MKNHRMMRRALEQYRHIVNLSRRYSSTLYVTGDKAQTNFAVLTPFISFEETLHRKNDMLANIAARKLPINFDQIEERWTYFKSINDRKKSLEEARAEIGRTIAELMKKSPQNNEEISRLKLHLKIVKDDYKSIRDMNYSVEEDTMLKILNLPNDLHPKAAKGDKEEIIYSHPVDLNTVKTETHFEIGNEKGYFKYINPMICFLKSDASKFELAVQNHFHRCLLELESKYIQFSSPDFVRSVVVEGCGVNPADSVVFTLENIHCVKNRGLNKLHLVGASSLYSFMAYFTKHSVQSSHLPLKAFSVGRCYQPVTSEEPSLFNLGQTSNVNVFLAYKEDEDVFDSLVEEVTSIYGKFGFHFRIVLPPAQRLSRSESLRISIEMFSNYLQSYVEVGSVSFYERYLSKRLLFNYMENKNRKYPKVAAGSIVNIHRVLGCVIENNASGKELIPIRFVNMIT